MTAGVIRVSDGHYVITATSDAPADLNAVFADLNANPTENAIIELGDGYAEYTTKAGSTADIVLDGNGTTTKVTLDGKGTGVLTAVGPGTADITAGEGKTFVFKNMTIRDHSVSYAENSWDYGYLEFGGNLQFEDVNFVSSIQVTDGKQSTSTATFNNCKFTSDTEISAWTPSPESMYLVWVASGEVSFSECEFTGFRGLKIHNEYSPHASGYGNTLVVDHCNFHDITKKTGVDMGKIARSANITIKNSTFKNCAINGGTMIYKSATDIDTFTFNRENNTQLLEDGLGLDDAGNVLILSANGLVAAAPYFKKGGTFVLADNIDMTGIEYESPQISYYQKNDVKDFVFDGNGKTISNLTTKSEEEYAGLFGKFHPGAKNVTIKNLTIKDATLNPNNAKSSENSAGALIGCLEGSQECEVLIQNVTADNITVNSAKMVGGLIGRNNEDAQKKLIIDGCTVKNTTINSAYTDDNGTTYKGHAGGVIGYFGSGTITNTTVSDSKIEYTLPHLSDESGPRAGALAGTAQAAAVIGTGNKVSSFYINDTKVTDKFIGAVDKRTNKDKDDTVIFE